MSEIAGVMQGRTEMLDSPEGTAATAAMLPRLKQTST
jgi:hypothetical protein